MKTKRGRFKIIAACSVAIFSLAALIGGSFAWFVLSLSNQSVMDEFVVVNNGQCELYSVNLIKFDYLEITYGSGDDEFTAIDYLNPQNGTVNKYGYDEETGTFGHYEEEVWKPVSIMNTYDPLEAVIFGSTLKDLNCNALYEFTVSADSFDDAYLNALAVKLSDKVKEEDEVFLSSCVNFDIYITPDLSDDNPAYTDGEGHKLYYPSYIEQSETLSENEEIYYKLSYLSSLEDSHAHFYGSADEEITIADSKEVEFEYVPSLETNQITFYVNVNYDPNELDYTSTKIYLGNIKAIYDFMFKFNFAERESD